MPGGSYTVVVSNSLEVAQSDEATLSVEASPPLITAQPRSQTVGYGAPVSFSVQATGSLPHRFAQWQLNEQDLEVTPGLSLTLTNIQPADSGLYRAIVWNDYGFDVSEEALLTAVPVVAWGS